jgi:hypothetical protein
MPRKKQGWEKGVGPFSDSDWGKRPYRPGYDESDTAPSVDISKTVEKNSEPGVIGWFDSVNGKPRSGA